jgi:hypothetical protein
MKFDADSDRLIYSLDYGSSSKSVEIEVYLIFLHVEGRTRSRIRTNNYGSGSGRPINLQLRIRNTVLNITFFFAVTSFRDEEYRTELEGGDEFIQVSVTSPHKVKLSHQRVLNELERTRLSRRRIIWLLPHPLSHPHLLTVCSTDDTQKD